MGMRMPETCWAVFKRQIINLRSCCIWLVDSIESMVMHGLANPKCQWIFTFWHSLILVFNVKSIPLHAKQEQRGRWGIALPTINSVTRMRWVVSATLRPRTPRKETPYPFYRRLRWHLVWMSPENLALTNFRTRNPSARSESQHRLYLKKLQLLNMIQWQYLFISATVYRPVHSTISGFR
jgi:hypothetical protein